MKKIIPLIILFVGFFAVAIWLTLNNAKTTLKVSKDWQIENRTIKKIALDGSEQPLKIIVKRTEEEGTQVHLEGKVSKSSRDLINESKQSHNSLTIPISKKGFKLATSASGKDTLTLEIDLGKNANFKELLIDTWVGEINVEVPSEFDGTYNVKLNNGAELLDVPDTKKTMDSTITIDAYSDVKIVKKD